MEDKYLRCHLKSLKMLENFEFDKAQKQLEGLYQINFKPSKFELLTLNNLAVIYAKQKNFSKSCASLEKAQHKLKGQGSRELLGTYINLSSAASYLNNHMEALSYGLQAKQLISFDSKLAAIVNYNLAVEYLHLSRLQECEKTLKQALSDLNENPDSNLSQLAYSLLTFLSSRRSKEPDSRQIKLISDSLYRKKVLKKNTSANELPKTTKIKKVEKDIKPLKRAESHNQVSSRNLNSNRRIKEKTCPSNTSSTESIKNISGQLRSSFGSSKTIRRLLSENVCKTSGKGKKGEVGNRIQIIGDHLSSIEKKLNDFVELCKPLVTLTEDPDEQLDSHRIFKDNSDRNVQMRMMWAAVRIQRAWRKCRNEKIMKRSLIKFRDNPLFKQSSSIKTKKKLKAV